MVEVFRLVVVANKTELKRRLISAAPNERAFLKAVVTQYNGDVDGAIRSLRRQIRSLTGDDQAVVAEVLAPMLIMRHDNEAVLSLAEILADRDWTASAYALRSLVHADSGRMKEARIELAAARDALESEENEIRTLLVLQRLARSSLLVGDFDGALNLAAEGAAAATRLAAWRVAAADYSVSHNVHYNVTGDHEQARHFAALWYEAASKADDASFVYPALVADYEMAVRFADDERIRYLDRAIRSKLLPQQYAEHFYYAFAYALARGAEDLRAMRTLLEILKSSAGLSRGQMALCSSLIGLADAAALDDRSARSSIRQTISKLGRPSARDLAHERFNRRMARATVAAACVLVGDDVRADRIVKTSELRNDHAMRLVPGLMRSRQWDIFAPSLAGLARVYRTASRSRLAEQPPGDLTPSEVDVLRLYDRGWNASRIARETGRSVHTIYSHSRSIFGKLEAANALEAVAIARERGLLT